jgi:hypothetical protein
VTLDAESPVPAADAAPSQDAAPQEAALQDVTQNMTSPVRRREWLVPAALAIVMLLQLLVSVRQLSQTSDEANHLHAGYRYWQCRDFGYNVEHPPLAKLVAALPLRAVAVRDPFPAACGSALGSDFQMGRQFLFAGDADRLLGLGRFAVSFFSLATLLLAWWWTRAMFGVAAANITAILLAFEPNLLAHGALVTTDAAVSFGMLASVAVLWFCARRPTGPRVALAGLAIGVALAAKFSGIVVIPIALALSVVDVLRRREPRAAGRALLFALAAGCVALAFVWGTYGLRFAARPGGAPNRFSRADWEPGAPRLLPPLLKLHLVPEAYVAGLGHVLRQAKEGQPMFLFGRVYDSGRWFYFPSLLLIKLTLPMLLLLTLSLAIPWWRGRGHDALYLVLPTFDLVRLRHALALRHRRATRFAGGRLARHRGGSSGGIIDDKAQLGGVGGRRPAGLPRRNLAARLPELHQLRERGVGRPVAGVSPGHRFEHRLGTGVETGRPIRGEVQRAMLGAVAVSDPARLLWGSVPRPASRAVGANPGPDIPEQHGVVRRAGA